MSRKSVLGIILILILLILGYFGRRYSNEVGAKTYSQFNNSNIYGAISHLRIKYRGVAFMINGNQTEFIFYPITDKFLNAGHIFDHFAQIGDTILKAAYSDTLYLIKNKKIFKYEFAMPEDFDK